VKIISPNAPWASRVSSQIRTIKPEVERWWGWVEGIERAWTQLGKQKG